MSVKAVLRRLAARLGWRGLEQDLRDDVAFHLEMSVAAFRAAGHPPDEAERLARVKFGGVDRVEEAVRDEAGGRALRDLTADLRHGLRVLVRSPGFSTVAIGSLALGIGASAAMFGIVDAVLLRPLPYPAAEQLVQVMVRNVIEDRDTNLSMVDVQALLAGTRAFSAAGPVFPQQAGFSVVGAEGAEQVRGSWVSPGAMAALGVRPMLGPGLRPDDERPGAPPVVLLSAGYWRERFGGDPQVIGQTMRVEGESRTIAGVMPPSFRLPGFLDDDLWLVPPFEPATERRPFYMRMFARLATNRTASDARADVAPIARTVAAANPGSYAEWQYSVTPMRDYVVRDSRATIWMLAGAMGLVMLIAIANVSTLLIVRTTTREPELAVRMALGAGRGRIARQLLTEGALVAFAGGAAGVFLATLSLGFAVRAAGDALPRMHEVTMTSRVLFTAAALSIGAALAIGIAAVTRVSGDQGAWLRQGARAASDRMGAGRLRESFVIAEFALAVTVMVGAVLLVASLRRLEAVDPGAEARQVLAVRLSLPYADYPEPDRTLAFYQALEERLAMHPEVQAAAVTMGLPPNLLVMRNPAYRADRPPAAGEDVPVVEELMVSPEYFRAMGIPLRRGRPFTSADRTDAPRVAIVNEEMARRFFPDADALGARLGLGDPDPDATTYEIVGVVADVKYQGLDEPPHPTVYVPYAQHAWWNTMYLVLRTAGEPLDLLPEVRAHVSSLDARVPLQEISTFGGLLHDSVRVPRLRSRLLLAFAGIATVLAMTGIYGVMSYTITQRMREMSIRTALGARSMDVLGLVIRSGLRMAALGATLGIVAALAMSRVMEKFVFGVEPTNAGLLLLSSAVLLLAALGATLGPAVRAARAQPAQALRAG
jgi:predicted permease